MNSKSHWPLFGHIKIIFGQILYVRLSNTPPTRCRTKIGPCWYILSSFWFFCCRTKFQTINSRDMIHHHRQYSLSSYKSMLSVHLTDGLDTKDDLVWYHNCLFIDTFPLRFRALPALYPAALLKYHLQQMGWWSERYVHVFYCVQGHLNFLSLCEKDGCLCESRNVIALTCVYICVCVCVVEIK